MCTKKRSISKQYEVFGQGAHESSMREHPFHREEGHTLIKNMGTIDSISRVILAVVVGNL